MGKGEKKLFQSLRERGLRKRTAGALAKATSGSGNSKTARRAVADLASVVDELSDRLRHGPEKRSAAAKKAAQTRKQRERARSEAAKRGARTRAQTR
jgi:hypothetical protein